MRSLGSGEDSNIQGHNILGCEHVHFEKLCLFVLAFIKMLCMFLEKLFFLCVLAYPSRSCVYMCIDFLKVDQRYTFVFSCTKGIETQIHKSIKNKLANSKDALPCGETYRLR